MEKINMKIIYNKTIDGYDEEYNNDGPKFTFEKYTFGSCKINHYIDKLFFMNCTFLNCIFDVKHQDLSKPDMTAHFKFCSFINK